MTGSPLLPTVLAALLSFILTVPLRHWLVQRGIVDHPGFRRSHSTPTPRGGGVAIAAALIATVVVQPGFDPLVWIALAFVLALAVLGWIDDRRNLHPFRRLAVQVVAVVAVLGSLGGIQSVVVFGQELSAPWLWSALAAIAALWLINLHNFMDGSDGLAAMQGLWTGAVMGWLLHGAGAGEAGWFALAAAGAFGGFLVWNRPPARIFMGDAGSLVLGAVVAWLALYGAATGHISIWVSLLVTSVFVVDATATLVLRLVRGERWYTPHRQHAYQLLLSRGWSHGRILALYAAVNLLLVLPGVVLATVYPRLDLVVAALLALLLIGGWWVIHSATTTENARHE